MCAWEISVGGIRSEGNDSCCVWSVPVLSGLATETQQQSSQGNVVVVVFLSFVLCRRYIGSTCHSHCCVCCCLLIELARDVASVFERDKINLYARVVVCWRENLAAVSL